ncbi:MAG: GHKL domain-containing protein [Bacteroidetes bacterium]|nr:GHKL domain-containing protein [Bacteroidota bacterium]
MTISLKTLSKIYELSGDAKKSYQYYQQVIVIDEQIDDQKLELIESRYEQEKRQETLTKLKEETAADDLVLRKARNKRTLLVIGLALVIGLLAGLLSMYMLRRNAGNALALKKEEIEWKNQELDTANKNLKDFAQVISHDLKAPLKGIGIVADELALKYSEVLDQQGRDYIQILSQKARRMQQLIADVLTYSMHADATGHRELVNLDALVRDSIDFISAPEKIHIHVDVLLPSISGERIQLGQLFQNLLSNAVKFNDKETGYINIGCSELDEEWKFYVKDNGKGIDSKYHTEIFQLFQTIDQKDKYQSTGIGLALVKKVIDNHGGEIWLESEVGKGTIFYFTMSKVT